MSNNKLSLQEDQLGVALLTLDQVTAREKKLSLGLGLSDYHAEQFELR